MVLESCIPHLSRSGHGDLLIRLHIRPHLSPSFINHRWSLCLSLRRNVIGQDELPDAHPLEPKSRQDSSVERLTRSTGVEFAAQGCKSPYSSFTGFPAG
jgi:hypothetical protein